MSLQVWLPLTKDLRQQGLDNITVTTANTNNFQNEGKLSNKSLDVSGHYAFLVPSLVKKRVFSCAFWYKPITDSSLSDNWRRIIVFDTYTSDGSTTGAIFRFESSYGYQSSSTTYCISIHNNVGEPIASIGTGLGETDGWNKWQHIAITADGTTLKCYRNGVQVASGNMGNGGMLQGTVHIGYSGNRPIGRLNDFRLYDHCLSQMEVKELSKGLVLHYPLSDKYIESTTNLITTEDCLSATCFNGATNKYSYGTNTDMYKTVTTYDGRKGTKVYMGTNGNSCYPYVYINNMFTSDGTNAPAYKTLSFDYYTTISTSICPYKLGSGTGTATYKVINNNGIKTGTGTNSVTIPVVPNAWNHIEITFHGTTAANSEWGYIQNQPTHTSNTSNFWFFTNMQLEAKDHATGYVGSNGTRSTGTVYDCSGLCNNGIIYKYDNNGDIIIDSNTPKYALCTHIQAGSPTVSNTTGLCYIYSNFALTTPNQLTISFWCKPIHNYQDSTSRQGVFCTTNGSIGIDAGTDYNTTAMHHRDSSIDMCQNNGTSNNFGTPFVVNEWHHYTFLYNGKNMQWYKDGVFQSEKAFSSAGDLKSFSALVIGFTKAGGVYRKNDCYISDFRIYATALSAEDVLELYHTAAHIDNLGNTWVYQYNEI